MEVITQTHIIQKHLSDLRKVEKKTAFVPTMGALHEGHLSLVHEAKKSSGNCVVSIFVNPTQFNNADDLKNYPRTEDRDLKFLQQAGADVVFIPAVKEIYPDDQQSQMAVDLGNLGTVMEGRHRPGHFNGVVQVVSRLFDIIQPDSAYFGEKDFQQLAIIRRMVELLKYDVQIIAMPTVRESNGLAMSSRNERLSADEKNIASSIYRILNEIKDDWKDKQPEELIADGIKELNSISPLRVEYIEAADENTLEPVTDNLYSGPVRIFAAVFCGGVRLIDNVAIN